jgi:hypothetical protein
MFDWGTGRHAMSACNVSNRENPPRLPADFEPDIAFDDVPRSAKAP